LEGIRLEHGRTLLSSDMPVKSIAAQCGYTNAQQFAKAYSRHFGITVKEARSKNQ
jgi:transcriptional regulator GlxA family with amidase domain